MTSTKENYAKTIPFIKKSRGGSHGADVLGLHLEGPFISTEKKGAHKLEYIQNLNGGFQDIMDTYGNLDDVSIITLAPELGIQLWSTCPVNFHDFNDLFHFRSKLFCDSRMYQERSCDINWSFSSNFEAS